MKDKSLKALLSLHKENKKLIVLCTIGGCILATVAGVLIYKKVKSNKEFTAWLDEDEDCEEEDDDLEIIDLDIDGEE